MTAQIHAFDTVLIPNHTKINMQGCVATYCKWKIFGKSRILYKWVGLIRESGLISNFDSEGRGLLERGA